MESIKYKGYEIEISQDEYPESPREWDNLGKIVGYCKSYILFDIENKFSGEGGNHYKDFLLYIQNEYNILQDKEGYKKDSDNLTKADFIRLDKWIEKNIVLLPVYAYIHSGVSLKVGSFQGLLPQGHAEFDSGQIGYIYVTKDKILKDFNVKKITKKIREEAVNCLISEIETFNQYLEGDIYGYNIKSINEACRGYYGYDYCLQEAKDVVDCYLKQEIKKHIQQVKAWIKNKVSLLNRKPLTI